MRPVAVLYFLGWLLAISAVAMLVPTVFAAALDPPGVAQRFFVPAIAIGVVGGNLIFAFKGPAVTFGRRQSLMLMAAVWIVVPLACAFPFMVVEMPHGYMGAYFESVSGFTTTGATVFTDLKDVPRSIIVWRALLQWLGGLATLIAIGGLIGPLAGREMSGSQFELISRTNEVSTRHVREAIETITPLYGALTAGCFILLIVSGMPPFDAFCFALSTVATGGFMPKDGTLALYELPLAEIVLSVTMVVSAVSIVWVRAIIQGRWSIVRDMREPYFVVLAVVGTGLLLGLTIIPEVTASGPFGWLHAMTQGLTTAASLISTTGIATSELGLDAIPYMALLAMCIVGAGRFSTAGGLKVFRVIAMLRQFGRELRLLIYPNAVRPSRYGDETSDVAMMKVVWTTLVAFVLAISVVAVTLGYAGLPLPNAIIASAASVSNAGPIYEIARINELKGIAPIAEMSPLAYGAMAFGMILGRLEVVAILSLFTMAYWRS